VNKFLRWVRRADQGGIIRSVWEELSEPWRACVEEAWEAYRSGSLPIGAVVTDAYGHVLSRGRNRIHERSGPSGVVFDHKLAHAELNALLSLDHREYDPQACVLWTTTEPCPLCVGAARMSEVGELRYASREPWGGSTAMFETVPYLKRKNVGVMGPQDGRLEGVLVALQVESFLRLQPKILERFLRLYEETMPEATAAGRRLHRSGLLRTMSEERAPASEVLVRVDNEVASAPEHPAGRPTSENPPSAQSDE
jgi:tRNA(adenine34) deaminase